MASSTAIERVILLVLDSVGCGELPDAASYGDEGSNTLGHTLEHAPSAHLPVLQSIGMGNILPLHGVAAAVNPTGAFGKCAELSAGKDTATGHWELAGLRVTDPFPLYPTGFPEEILSRFRQLSGRGVLGNKPASGTEIIQELGDAHRSSGDLIVYTSGDSVFQIAAHEDVVPVDELHRICAETRRLLDPYRIGRVIARPFVGDKAGEYARTYNRKDYAMPPPSDTVLDLVANSGRPVVGVGKIPDIYCGHGVTRAVHTEGNLDGMKHCMELVHTVDKGLIMVNLVDFDTLYGHRRNPGGYYDCLQEFDEQLGHLAETIDPARDLVLITADHGNDPTMPGTDHTREYVPVLAFGPTSAAGVNLGTRTTFADVGATVADVFGLGRPPYGTSFLSELTA